MSEERKYFNKLKEELLKEANNALLSFNNFSNVNLSLEDFWERKNLSEATKSAIDRLSSLESYDENKTKKIISLTYDFFRDLKYYSDFLINYNDIVFKSKDLFDKSFSTITSFSESCASNSGCNSEILKKIIFNLLKINKCFSVSPNLNYESCTEAEKRNKIFFDESFLCLRVQRSSCEAMDRFFKNLETILSTFTFDQLIEHIHSTIFSLKPVKDLQNNVFYINNLEGLSYFESKMIDLYGSLGDVDEETLYNIIGIKIDPEKTFTKEEISSEICFIANYYEKFLSNSAPKDIANIIDYISTDFNKKFKLNLTSSLDFSKIIEYSKLILKGYAINKEYYLTKDNDKEIISGVTLSEIEYKKLNKELEKPFYEAGLNKNFSYIENDKKIQFTNFIFQKLINSKYSININNSNYFPIGKIETLIGDSDPKKHENKEDFEDDLVPYETFLDKNIDDSKINTDKDPFLSADSIPISVFIYLKTEMKSLKLIMEGFNEFYVKEKERLRNIFYSSVKKESYFLDTDQEVDSFLNYIFNSKENPRESLLKFLVKKNMILEGCCKILFEMKNKDSNLRNIYREKANIIDNYLVFIKKLYQKTVLSFEGLDEISIQYLLSKKDGVGFIYNLIKLMFEYVKFQDINFKKYLLEENIYKDKMEENHYIEDMVKAADEYLYSKIKGIEKTKLGEYLSSNKIFPFSLNNLSTGYGIYFEDISFSRFELYSKEITTFNTLFSIYSMIGKYEWYERKDNEKIYEKLNYIIKDINLLCINNNFFEKINNENSFKYLNNDLKEYNYDYLTEKLLECLDEKSGIDFLNSLILRSNSMDNNFDIETGTYYTISNLNKEFKKNMAYSKEDAKEDYNKKILSKCFEIPILITETYYSNLFLPNLNVENTKKIFEIKESKNIDLESFTFLEDESSEEQTKKDNVDYEDIKNSKDNKSSIDLISDAISMNRGDWNYLMQRMNDDIEYKKACRYFFNKEIEDLSDKNVLNFKKLISNIINYGNIGDINFYKDLGEESEELFLKRLEELKYSEEDLKTLDNYFLSYKEERYDVDSIRKSLNIYFKEINNIIQEFKDAENKFLANVKRKKKIDKSFYRFLNDDLKPIYFSMQKQKLKENLSISDNVIDHYREGSFITKNPTLELISYISDGFQEREPDFDRESYIFNPNISDVALILSSIKEDNFLQENILEVDEEYKNKIYKKIKREFQKTIIQDYLEKGYDIRSANIEANKDVSTNSLYIKKIQDKVDYFIESESNTKIQEVKNKNIRKITINFLTNKIIKSVSPHGNQIYSSFSRKQEPYISYSNMKEYFSDENNNSLIIKSDDSVGKEHSFEDKNHINDSYNNPSMVDLVRIYSRLKDKSSKNIEFINSLIHNNNIFNYSISKIFTIKKVLENSNYTYSKDFLSTNHIEAYDNLQEDYFYQNYQSDAILKSERGIIVIDNKIRKDIIKSIIFYEDFLNSRYLNSLNYDNIKKIIDITTKIKGSKITAENLKDINDTFKNKIGNIYSEDELNYIKLIRESRLDYIIEEIFKFSEKNSQEEQKVCASLIKKISSAFNNLSNIKHILQYADSAKQKDEKLFDLNFKSKNFRFRVIKDLSGEYFNIGKITDCCQYIGGAGEGTAIDSFVNNLSGVVIFEVFDDKNNSKYDSQKKDDYIIVSQSYFHYVPEQNLFILDNVEASIKAENILKEYLGENSLNVFYAALAIKLKELGYDKVIIGKNNDCFNDLSSYFKGDRSEDKRHFEHPPTWLDYNHYLEETAFGFRLDSLNEGVSKNISDKINEIAKGLSKFSTYLNKIEQKLIKISSWLYKNNNTNEAVMTYSLLKKASY